MELDDLKKSWNALDEHLKTRSSLKKRDSTTAGTCP